MLQSLPQVFLAPFKNHHTVQPSGTIPPVKLLFCRVQIVKSVRASSSGGISPVNELFSIFNEAVCPGEQQSSKMKDEMQTKQSTNSRRCSTHLTTAMLRIQTVWVPETRHGNMSSVSTWAFKITGNRQAKLLRASLTVKRFSSNQIPVKFFNFPSSVGIVPVTAIGIGKS